MFIRGEYWTFKVSTFEVPLVSIAKEFTGEVAVKTARNASVEYSRDLKLEDVIALVKPITQNEGFCKRGAVATGCPKEPPPTRPPISTWLVVRLVSVV